MFPSEMEDVPQELELRMSAQHKFEGGGSRDWIDLSDRRPPPPMSVRAAPSPPSADALLCCLVVSRHSRRWARVATRP